MINTDQLVWGVTVACVFIALGLVPGLMHDLADTIGYAADQLSFLGFPILRRPRSDFEQPRWFALVGLTLIAITLLLYLSR